MKSSIKFLLVLLALFAFLSHAENLKTEASNQGKEKNEGKEGKGSVLLVFTEVKQSGSHYASEKKEEKTAKSASGSDSDKDSASENKAAQVKTIIPIVPIIPRPLLLAPEHKFVVPIVSKTGSSSSEAKHEDSLNHTHTENCTDVNETEGNGSSSVHVEVTDSSVISIEITVGSHHENDGKAAPAAETKGHDQEVAESIRSVLAPPVRFRPSSEGKNKEKKVEDNDKTKTEAPKDQK